MEKKSDGVKFPLVDLNCYVWSQLCQTGGQSFQSISASFSHSPWLLTASSPIKLCFQLHRGVHLNFKRWKHDPLLGFLQVEPDQLFMPSCFCLTLSAVSSSLSFFSIHRNLLCPGRPFVQIGFSRSDMYIFGILSSSDVFFSLLQDW